MLYRNITELPTHVLGVVSNKDGWCKEIDFLADKGMQMHSICILIFL